MTEPVWTAAEWAALGAVLSGAGTIIGALAVIGAAYLGSRTFEGWRKQTLSQRRIEQAERILIATYKVRRGLAHVRNPMLFPHELKEAEVELKERNELPGNEEVKRKMATAQAYYTRLNAALDHRRLLEECQPMARALFGEALELALGKLNSQFNSVNSAVRAQYYLEEDTDRAFRERIEATLWSEFPTPQENAMDREIADLVATIEKQCVPVLQLDK